MHRSMSSPTYPRSGRGGDWKVIEKAKPQILHPDNLEVQIPY